MDRTVSFIMVSVQMGSKQGKNGVKTGYFFKNRGYKKVLIF